MKNIRKKPNQLCIRLNSEKRDQISVMLQKYLHICDTLLKKLTININTMTTNISASLTVTTLTSKG